MWQCMGIVAVLLFGHAAVSVHSCHCSTAALQHWCHAATWRASGNGPSSNAPLGTAAMLHCWAWCCHSWNISRWQEHEGASGLAPAHLVGCGWL